MRRIATTLLVTAATAVPAVAAPATSAQLSPIVDETLEQLPVEPLPQLPEPPPLPQLPQLPQLPALPELPEVAPPEVPAPTPAPPLLPAPRGPDLPPAAGEPPRRGAAGPAAAAREEPARATPPSPASAPRSAAGDDRAARQRSSAPTAAAGPRPDRSRGAGRSTGRSGVPAVSTRPAAARVAVPASAPAAAAEPPSIPARVADEVADLVRALPPWLLWALAGTALVALVMAVNAFWQWRRRMALEAQRAELLDDIGVLSRALLPPVPAELDGLAVSAAYRPADGPAAGGDFYDVFVIGERRVCVLVGDVSGHGRESVTQAALARYTLRTLLAAGHPPGEALARADALLARDLRPNFVTVIAGVYDPATGELTYAKAGHAPPIVLGAEHHPESEQPATPLGLGLGESWPEFRVRVGEGVSVCLFTDGLEDARTSDGRVGRDAVQRLLAAQEEPEAGRLLCDLEGFASTLCDDTAAIVLSRR